MRICLIGIGAIAQHHVRAAIRLGHEVSAACATSIDSENWGNIEQQVPGIHRFDDWRTALAQSNYDAAIIALPWNRIDPILTELLTNPRPMLIEKPAALSVAQLKQAIAAEKSAHAPRKIVGFNRRFYRTAQALRRRLAEGGLKSARIVIAEDLERQIVRHGSEISKHILEFSAVAHALDLMLYLLPGIQMQYRSGDLYRDGAAQVILETPGGVSVSLSLVLNGVDYSGQTYYFSDGSSWVLQPIEHLEKFASYDVAPASNRNAIRVFTPNPTVVASEIFPAGHDTANQDGAFVTLPFESNAPDGVAIKPGLLSQIQCLADIAEGKQQSERLRKAATLDDSLVLKELIDQLISPNWNGAR
jgi:predicted dehydrogenase